MFKQTKNLISVVFTIIKFFFIKLIRGKNFSYGAIERFSPGTMINIWKNGKLHLGKRVRAHTGVRLSVTTGAELIVGDNTSFNYNCILVARKRIEIGSDCTFGPGVVVYDHDHDFRNTEKMNSDLFLCDDIVIGNNVWIGANAIILKGTHIGDNCVIAAGTLVRGEIESGCVVYNPKEIATKKY